MSTRLNFMPLIESYVSDEQVLKESLKQVEEKEASLDELVSALQKPEVTLKEIDTYLQVKSGAEYLRRMYEEDISSHQQTKLQIIEILSAFPNLSKIQLNQSKTNPQYLSWDLEASTFTLTGF